MNAPTHSYFDEMHAAMQWWRDAGMDCEFHDDATDWLAPKESGTGTKGHVKGEDPSGLAGKESIASANKKSPAPLPERIDLLGDSPPQTLEEFYKWWLEAPGLDGVGPRGRIAPRGNAQPKLMILVLDPEESDRTQLLSGAQGRLLARMLAAMGYQESEVYFASALPRHTPMADTLAIAQSGMDSVVKHHIKLVSPQKILVFGARLLPFIDEKVTKSEKSLREINQSSRNGNLLVVEVLDSLLAMPRLKARFWRRWIEWSSQ